MSRSSVARASTMRIYDPNARKSKSSPLTAKVSPWCYYRNFDPAATSAGLEVLMPIFSVDAQTSRSINMMHNYKCLNSPAALATIQPQLGSPHHGSACRPALQRWSQRCRNTSDSPPLARSRPPARLARPIWCATGVASLWSATAVSAFECSWVPAYPLGSPLPTGSPPREVPVNAFASPLRELPLNGYAGAVPGESR